MTPRHVAALIWFERWYDRKLTHKNGMADRETDFWHRLRDEAVELEEEAVEDDTPLIQFPPGMAAIAGMVLAAALFSKIVENWDKDKALEIEKAPRRVQYEERRKRQ